MFAFKKANFHTVSGINGLDTNRCYHSNNPHPYKTTFKGSFHNSPKLN